MLKKIFSFSIFLFLLLFFLLNGKNISADVATHCCPSGSNWDTTCNYFENGSPHLGMCRPVEGPIEDAACGISYGGSGWVCDDTPWCCVTANDPSQCHAKPGYIADCNAHNILCSSGRQCTYSVNPGTFYCNNCQYDPMTGEWRCHVLSNSCSSGYIPNCSACAPSGVYNNPCAPDTSCNLPCIEGGLGGNGEDCNCNEECQDGYICNEARHCEPEGYFYDCCDPANGNADCPDRAGYEKACDIVSTSCATGHQCSWHPTTPQYECHWQPSGYGSCLLVPGSDAACLDIGCSADCSLFPEAGDPVYPQCGGFHNCICPSPTPIASLPTIFYEQCGKYCDPDSEHPFGNCLVQRRDDICVRPPVPAPTDPAQIDCTIQGTLYDCWCCSELIIQITIRPPFNPLCGPEAINTAIGCIPIGSQNSFLVFILRWGLGIAGGASFLLIVYSGFAIMTAGGDKRKVQTGRELLTAAISGLILIIFSVFILDLIGIRILRIPGLV